MQSGTKVGIITGVVSSLLVLYLFDPLLRALGGTVFYLLNLANSGIWDSLYAKAALGVPRDPAVSMFSMMAGVFSGVTIGVVTAVVKNTQEVRSVAQLSPANRSGNSKKALGALNSVFRVGGKSKKLLAVMLYLVSFCLVAGILYSMWSYQFQYKIVTSFDQHLRILTPFMSDRERVKIVSDFSRMTSESDYKNVYAALNGVAAENKITLPENPSYNVWAF